MVSIVQTQCANFPVKACESSFEWIHELDRLKEKALHCQNKTIAETRCFRMLLELNDFRQFLLTGQGECFVPESVRKIQAHRSPRMLADKVQLEWLARPYGNVKITNGIFICIDGEDWLGCVSEYLSDVDIAANAVLGLS